MSQARAPGEAAAADSRRIVWLCRRGTKELDVLLERFVHGPYADATAAQKHAFLQLLQLPDEQLAEYLFGHATPEDPQIASLAKLIARHRPDAAPPAAASDRLARADDIPCRQPGAR